MKQFLEQVSNDQENESQIKEFATSIRTDEEREAIALKVIDKESLIKKKQLSEEIHAFRTGEFDQLMVGGNKTTSAAQKQEPKCGAKGPCPETTAVQ
mmetsp:Transcript_42730/g.65617  ORF Transcript_42730/g.65617 Transcript_42730/m.65617 type:complete len:97 (+) Transcript_42730:834-1124(+)